MQFQPIYNPLMQTQVTQSQWNTARPSTPGLEQSLNSESWRGKPTEPTPLWNQQLSPGSATLWMYGLRKPSGILVPWFPELESGYDGVYYVVARIKEDYGSAGLLNFVFSPSVFSL